MKAFKTIALSLAVSTGVQADMIVTNAISEATTNLVVDASGAPIAASSGFVAVGGFDVPKASVVAAASTTGAGAYLAEHFTSVHQGAMGVGGVPGVFEMFVPCLPGGDPLVGRPAYTVIANGTSLATSSAFLIYQHATPFAAAGGFGFSEVMLAAGSSGQLIVGEIGTHQAAAAPFQLADAYSLAESGSLTLSGVPTGLAVEPGVQYSTTLVPSIAGASFSKVSGPSWVTVGQGGGVDVHPRQGTRGVHTVVVRAEAQGGQVVETAFSIDISASFAVWQDANFDLPAEAALADPNADPDGDGIVNLLEYAVRGSGDQNDSGAAPVIHTDEGGHLVVELDVRDDDPRLDVWFETTDDLSFVPFEVAGDSILPSTGIHAPTQTALGNGWKRIRFRSPAALDSSVKRAEFVRAMLSREP